MAKKYLLYIHRPEFQDEEKKSELVNQLLEDWYDLEETPSTKPGLRPPPVAKKPKVPTIIKTPEQSKKVVEPYVGFTPKSFSARKKK